MRVEGPCIGRREVGEGEVCLLVAEHVGLDAEREGRIGVAELLGNPSNRLARGESQARPGVAGAVQPEGSDTECLRPASDAPPGPFEVVRVHRAARLTREDPFGRLRPAAR